jgi:dTDP-4-dehydrorhamnose 3,5-epimerase
MKFIETKFKDAYLIELNPIEDERGFFSRVWCENELSARGINNRFVQCNRSYSKSKGTFRGIHFQSAPYEEAKLVSCIKGSVFDIIIDLREASPTYLKWEGYYLTEENRKQLYMPKGFGHGYLTLADHTELLYLVTAFYNKESEGGLRWDDPALGIHLPSEITSISKKDQQWAFIEVK